MFELPKSTQLQPYSKHFKLFQVPIAGGLIHWNAATFRGSFYIIPNRDISNNKLQLGYSLWHGVYHMTCSKNILKNESFLARGTPSCQAPNFHCGMQLLRTETPSDSWAKIGKTKKRDFSGQESFRMCSPVIQPRIEISKSFNFKKWGGSINWAIQNMDDL